MTTNLEFNDTNLCEDVALATWLGLSCPTNIRRTIAKHREELESYGELLELRWETDNASLATGFLLNPGQVLVLAAISRAPGARMVRAEMIRRYGAMHA